MGDIYRIDDDSDDLEDEADERPLNPEELKLRAESQYKLGTKTISKKPKIPKMRR